VYALCRSEDFALAADRDPSSSDTTTLLLLLTPAALLLLCCCGVFFVACPYYDKIVRCGGRACVFSLISVVVSVIVVVARGFLSIDRVDA